LIPHQDYQNRFSENSTTVTAKTGGKIRNRFFQFPFLPVVFLLEHNTLRHNLLPDCIQIAAAVKG